MRHREAGSIFIETLVAAAIVALVVALSFQTISASALRGRQVEARRCALLLAQSRMSALQGDPELSSGDAVGVDGPYLWRTDVSAASATTADSPAGVLAMASVTVQDRQGGPELASLKTLVLLPAPAS